MKTITANGMSESSGAPLPHDEWTAEQQKAWDAEAKGKKRSGGAPQEDDLEEMKVAELRERAKSLNVQGYSELRKDELVSAIEKAEKQSAKK